MNGLRMKGSMRQVAWSRERRHGRSWPSSRNADAGLPPLKLIQSPPAFHAKTLFKTLTHTAALSPPSVKTSRHSLFVSPSTLYLHMTESILDSDLASLSSVLTALQTIILLRSVEPRETVISEWVM